MWISEKNLDGTWPRGQKVMLNGQFDGHAVDPDIVDEGIGIRRMYFFKGYFVTTPPPGGGPNSIYSSQSTDGVHFSAPVLAFQHNDIFDPSVVKLTDDQYLMACSYVSGGLTHTVLATSVDGGLTFNYNQTLLNTDIPELTLLDNGAVRLFYSAQGGIKSKISTDNGATWTDEPGFRYSSSAPVGDPSVVRLDNSKYLMFFKGFNGNGQPGPTGHLVMLAESTDGAHTFTLVQPLVLDSASVPEGFVAGSSPFTEHLPETPCNHACVFPNPCHQELQIMFGPALNPSFTDNEIRIFNSTGLPVFGKKIRNGQSEKISLDQLASGLYLVLISDEKSILFTGKIIID